MRIRLFAFWLVMAGFSQAASAQQFSDSPGLFGVFDEIRGGIIYPVQPSDDSGVILSGQIYSRSFVPPLQNYWMNSLLRPRLHFGGNVATGDDPINQIYGGLTWNFPFLDRYFFEASFGGTWHDGPIDSPGDGLDLGCHVMFREAIGIGANFGQRFRVVAQADHASHADLCDGGNSGITHAGVYVGYRF